MLPAGAFFHQTEQGYLLPLSTTGWDGAGWKWQEIEGNGEKSMKTARNGNELIIFTEIQVPARQWDAHRRQCALDNRDKLEHLSSPSPGMAAFPHYISSMCHSNTSPHTTYIVWYIKMSILKIQFAASVATPSSALCPFIRSQVRKSQMWEKII